MTGRPRILLVRFSSLGDVVLATAAVEALREDLPSAEVHVLTKPGFRDVFRNNPGVHGLVPWDPDESLPALAHRIRTGGYDWIADLHWNLRTAALRALTLGSRWRGYRKGAWRRRLAVWLKRPEVLPNDHVVDRYLAALRPLGVVSRRRLPKVYPGEEERARVHTLLRGAGWGEGAFPIALAPGARWATKAWPEDRWRELVESLAADAFPVLVGGREDAALAGRILGDKRGVNLAGQTSILETAAALALCRVLVTNDSAPLHLGTAVGTPVVALFGPTVGGFGFFPLGSRDTVIERRLSCRPCSLHGDPACPLEHHACLTEASAHEVGAAVARVLGAGREGGAP